MVDAISGAGAMTLETEAWGVDVVVVGSQKALALPPGPRVPGAVNARAWERIEAAKSPRFYFDLASASGSRRRTGETAFTPAISLVVALKAALDFVEALGGVDALVENAGTLAAMTRAAAQAPRRCRCVSPTAHGDALTALYPPAGHRLRRHREGR